MVTIAFLKEVLQKKKKRREKQQEKKLKSLRRSMIDKEVLLYGHVALEKNNLIVLFLFSPKENKIHQINKEKELKL